MAKSINQNLQSYRHLRREKLTTGCIGAGLDEDQLDLIQRELEMVLEAEQDEDDDAEFYSRYFDSTRNEMVWHCDHKGKLRNFAKFRNFPYSLKIRVSVTHSANRMATSIFG